MREVTDVCTNEFIAYFQNRFKYHSKIEVDILGDGVGVEIGAKLAISLVNIRGWLFVKNFIGT